MKFKNLQNDYIEESSIPFLWTLLFGFLYFAYKRIWSHCLISFILAGLTAGFSWLIYPFFAKAIVRKSFLRTGWVELTRSGEEIKQNIDYSNGQKTSFILVVVLLVALGVAFYPSWFADFLDKKNITSTQETNRVSSSVIGDNSLFEATSYYKDNNHEWLLYAYSSQASELDIFNFALEHEKEFGNNLTMLFYSDNVPWVGDKTNTASSDDIRDLLNNGNPWSYFYRVMGSKKEFQNCISTVNLYCQGRFAEQRSRMLSNGIEEVDIKSYLDSDAAKHYINQLKPIGS